MSVSRNDTCALPVKTTPPETGDYFPRVQLRQKLETAANTYRRIWVSAPGGAGKTTLIRHFVALDSRPLLWYQVDPGDKDPAGFFYYLASAADAHYRQSLELPLLTAELLPALDKFSRHYFHILFSKFPEGCVLVFDDCQENDDPELFGMILTAALEQLPKNSCLFIISREEPPPLLARHVLNRTLAHLGWQDLQLTSDETRDYIQWEKGRSYSETAERQIFELTQGWVAGLQLLLESNEELLSHDTLLFDRREVLFDYFAGEVIARLPDKTRSFLLACSFLPIVPVQLAGTLTGKTDTGDILRGMARENRFTVRIATEPETYRLHPLFRQFLHNQALLEFSSGVVHWLQVEAARLFVERDDLDIAADLLIRAQDWEKLIDLLLQHAEPLFMQRRTQTLLQWLEALPPSVRKNNPWLLYWTGSCRLAIDPPQAKNELEKAYASFSTQDNAAGCMLAWTMIVFAIVVGWSNCAALDIWIERFDEIRERFPEYPSPEIEARMVQGICKALTWRQPSRSDLADWAMRLEQIIQTSPDSNFRILAASDLVFYHTVAGKLATATALIESIQSNTGHVSQLSRLIWVTTRSVHDWITMNRDACLRAMAEGQEIIDDSGLYALAQRLYGQGITLGMTTGDLELAQTLATKVGDAPLTDALDRSFVCHLAADRSLYEGDITKAVELALMAVRAAEESGTPIPLSFSLGGLAYALFCNNQGGQAAKIIRRGIEASRGLTFLGSYCRLVAAYIDLKTGEAVSARQWLEEGLTMAAREGYLNFHIWRDEMMAELCREALKHGIEVEYVQRLAKVRNLKLDEADIPYLTSKEFEILSWVKVGKNTWEIATILSISERTVKFHVSNVLHKLDATSRSHAVAKAHELGLFGPN